MKEIEIFNHTIKIGTGSSTHHPERKGGMSTCDIRTWVCYDGDWFIPNTRSMFSIYENIQSAKK